VLRTKSQNWVSLKSYHRGDKNFLEDRPDIFDFNREVLSMSDPKIDIAFYVKCIFALERAFEMLNASEVEGIEFEIYRSATIKEFEIILEQSGKLLKKRLRPFFHSNKAADELYFKDIFRHAALHSLITTQEAERWLVYRDNRNSTSHDYGEKLANTTLLLIPEFIVDAKRLAEVINAA
jgi:nucleotidyltransferase substrate binding protein (TIGR01987 family)